MIHSYLPYRSLRKRLGHSERALADDAKMSRGSLRLLSNTPERSTVQSLAGLGSYFDRDVEILLSPRNVLAEYSTIAVSLNVERDGFDSWKIHFFNFVDEFRRTIDARLFILPPQESLDPKLRALLASIAKDLAMQFEISVPSWAAKRNFLPVPWFIAGMQALKASALVESPLPYRNNNIFVHENFLSRA